MNKLEANEQLMFVFPIENFETKVQELSFGHDLRMRSLTKEENPYVVEKRGPIEVTYPKSPRHCLEIKAENIGPAAKKAYPVISALRLLKPNLIGVNMILHREPPEKWWVFRYPGAMEVDTSLRRIKKGIYMLEENEKTNLVGLYSKISKMIVDRKLRFAVGRLNMTYSAKWLDTRLLDYMIALEGLYLTGESEKQFRLCCYMTSVLSSDSEDSTKEIWNYIHKAYDLRSRVVHGSGSLPREVLVVEGEVKTKVSVADFVDKIEEYTRQSIREFIGRGKNVKEVQSDIKAEVKKRIGTNVGAG